jgi:hypothetical protein
MDVATPAAEDVQVAEAVAKNGVKLRKHVRLS